MVPPAELDITAAEPTAIAAALSAKPAGEAVPTNVTLASLEDTNTEAHV